MNLLQSIKIFSLAIIIGFTNTQFIKAQEAEEIKTQPAQISFVSPLGTNGAASGRTINHFSVNLLYGVSAGVRGAELSGLAGKTTGSVVGGQFAGVANFSTGSVKGAQVSGLMNTSAGFNGLQYAGLVNIAKNDSTGEDNALHSSNGGQVSGLVNINQYTLKGVQAAGVLNLSSDSLQGMQLAGIMNASPYVQGAQISGFLNKTKVLSGVQIGIINIADSIQKGVQIGLLNFTKNGYRAAEIESNESFYVTANYKMGSERLYTIFSLAYKEQDGKNIWAPGFGLGTYFPVGDKIGFNIDAINYQVNEDEWWTSELNQLNKLKVNASYRLARHLTIYGGVSLNVMVSKLKATEENAGGSIFETPHDFYDKTHSDRRVIIYPGFNAGFRF